MHQWLYLIALICVGVCNASVTESDTIEDNAANALASLNLQISEVEESIRSKGNSLSKTELAQNWRELGSMYQTKYLTHHEIGGKHRFDTLAIRAYDNALKLDGTDPQVVVQTCVSKGVLQKETGSGRDAISTLKKAERHVKTDHDKAAVESAKADAYLMLGQLDDAVAAYEAALEYAPYRLNLYLPLTTSYREKNTHTKEDWLLLLDGMERAASRWQNSKKWPKAVIRDVEESWLRAVDDDPLSDKIPSHVHWAMFNAANAAGEYDLAWEKLERGHQIDVDFMRDRDGQSLSDAEARVQQELDAIKTLYRDGFWMDGLGHSSKVPVFIVGMLRSGSTLLETMLDAHPDVVGIGEHSFFSSHQGTFGRELLDYMGRGAMEEYDSLTDDLQEVIEKHGKVVLDKIKASAAAVQAIASQGQGRVREAKRIVDKMLFNYRSIGMIHMMFPHAVIIHTMRDPLDTLCSCYTHKFDDSGVTWATQPDRLALEYAVYLEVMQHYRTVLPGRVIDIRYEELVARPEAVMRQVLRAMDLHWDPAVLDFQRSNRSVQTHSMQQVRQGIYSHAIGGWRRHAGGMEVIKEAYTKRLPHLASVGVLPYGDRMNWEGDAAFDYEGAMSALADGSTSILPVSGPHGSGSGRGVVGGMSVEVGMSGEAVGSGGGSPAKAKTSTKKKKRRKKSKTAN